jgi:hypothetical protein
VCWALNTCASVLYVDVNSANPTPPYTNWATAAQSIQDAVDIAAASDAVLVTNGTYATGGKAIYGTMTNRVAVDKPLTVRSVNGPQFTIIEGSQVSGSFVGDGAVRCMYLTNGANLSGFTLTNGATLASVYYTEANGGGVYCESESVVVSNCIIIGNWAQYYGGGAISGTLRDCTLTGNSAGSGGGGASGSNLHGSTMIGNYAYSTGGGAEHCTANKTILRGNTSFWGGGAAYGTLTDCILNDNSAYDGGGAFHSTLINCVLSANSAAEGGGGAALDTLNNCTVVNNSASGFGGGAAGHYSNLGVGIALNNCIIQFNTAPSDPNFDSGFSILNYCCTAPQTTNGFRNITNEPLFIDLAGGNLRLQSNSPCINSGNNDSAPSGPDLDGNPRIVGVAVDIGAYEFQNPSSVISYAWLQYYGFPTDSSADYEDPDRDGMNNWQEWIAGTNPTNALSVLKMVAPSNAVPSIAVTWQSVAGITYFLQRGTNLTVQPPFLSLQSNIVGQVDTTTYMDTNGAGGGAFFYRVGVQQ